MPQYVKKPIVVDAEPFNPLDYPWPDGVIPWTDTHPLDGSYGYIQTLEGQLHVMAGSWIITGIAGEKYACRDDIFQATYDPVPATPMEEVSPLSAEQEKRVRVIVRDELVRCVRNGR